MIYLDNFAGGCRPGEVVTRDPDKPTPNEVMLILQDIENNEAGRCQWTLIFGILNLDLNDYLIMDFSKFSYKFHKSSNILNFKITSLVINKSEISSIQEE